MNYVIFKSLTQEEKLQKLIEARTLIGLLEAEHDDHFSLLACDAIDALGPMICTVKGKHDFIFDHCGYWQHKFCSNCGQKKYPDLALKSCDDSTKEMGILKEENYKHQIKG